MQKIKNEMWQISMIVGTEGATEEETARLVLRLKEVVKNHQHTLIGFRVNQPSMMDMGVTR